MKNYKFNLSQKTLAIIATSCLLIGTVQKSQAQFTPWANISSGSLNSNLPSWSVSLDRSSGINVAPTISFTSSGVLTYNRNGQSLSDRVDTIFTQSFSFLSGNVAGLQDIQFDFISSRSANNASVKLLLYDMNGGFIALIDSLNVSTSTASLNNGPNNLTTAGFYKLAIVIQNFRPNGNGNNTVNLSLDFSDFTTPQSILPVQEGLFSAKTTTEGVQLSWQNIEKFENFIFEIERGLEVFEKIGNISGLVLTEASNEFIFIDKNPMEGLNLYRLKIIQPDGSYSYSQILHTYFYQLIDKEQITVFPNPGGGLITIKGIEVKTLKIYTLSGIKLCEIPQDQVLNIDFLENGNYILHIESVEGKITQHRFLKE